MEGKGGAISKSFLPLGGCDNPCLALFISGLSHDLLSCPSHFNLESRQAPQLTSLPPCNYKGEGPAGTVNNQVLTACELNWE